MTTEWISTAERLPEPFEKVLIAVDIKVIKKRQVAAGYRLESKTSWNVMGCIWTDLKVTHWMPLPEPPQKGDGKQ